VKNIEIHALFYFFLTLSLSGLPVLVQQNVDSSRSQPERNDGGSVAVVVPGDEARSVGSPYVDKSCTELNRHRRLPT
jgi:hypothetical protein